MTESCPPYPNSPPSPSLPPPSLPQSRPPLALSPSRSHLQGVAVRVRRPSDYNPSMAAALGPTQPNPNLNLAAVGLSPG